MIFLLQFGKTWLENKVTELYKDTPDISSADIMQSIITLLNSPMTNDDMQNDLFELLGFDKFEFIQELLGHRQDVVNSLRAPPPQPSLAESKLYFKSRSVRKILPVAVRYVVISIKQLNHVSLFIYGDFQAPFSIIVLDRTPKFSKCYY